MTLCIDIGNSNIACGLWKDGFWTHNWRIATVVERTHDEYEVLMRSFLFSDGIESSAVENVSISSVVPGLNESFRRMIQGLFGLEPFWVSSLADVGMDVNIDNPRELGPDLFANAIAGWEKTHRSCIVVDFGTALSFTAVQDKKPRPAVVGVALAPGLGSAVKSLSGNTAQLPHVDLSPPPRAIGTNTVHSIQSGIIFGYVGLVEHLVGRISQELRGEVAVIATGGMSRILVPLTKVFTEVDPWLTLDGLRLTMERSQKG